MLRARLGVNPCNPHLGAGGFCLTKGAWALEGFLVSEVLLGPHPALLPSLWALRVSAVARRSCTDSPEGGGGLGEGCSRSLFFSS